MIRNFIYCLMAIVPCFLFTKANASEHLPDRSLSVEDTLREPSIRYTPQTIGDTGFSPNAPIDPNMTKQLQDLRAKNGKVNIPQVGEIAPIPSALPSQITSRGGSTKNYMNQFCSNVSAGNSCQETQKQQACERFRTAAVNVQQLLDRAIDCEVSAGNNADSDCDGLDAGRLDLLKQYWQDEDMSYTILFLPDMVLNVASNCATKHGVNR